MLIDLSKWIDKVPTTIIHIEDIEYIRSVEDTRNDYTYELKLKSQGVPITLTIGMYGGSMAERPNIDKMLFALNAGNIPRDEDKDDS